MATRIFSVMQIAGIIVIRAPEPGLLDKVRPILAMLEHVYVVDNTDDGMQSPDGLNGTRGITLIGNRNQGGLAGAYNAALERIATDRPHVTHVLFLDDDSETDALAVFLQSDATVTALARRDVAAVAPIYVERATGLSGAHIQLSRFTFKVLPRTLSEATDVTFLINSMSLWKIGALRAIGTYDSKLQVDHVDTDYCLRAKALGFRLVLNPTVCFRHSIGVRQQYRLCGLILQSGGHDAVRRRMIGRNTVLLAKRYGKRFPSFVVLSMARLCYEFLGIVLVETDRWPKVHALIQGVVQGLFAPAARIL